MESFRWNSCFITGLADVDDQHHELVDVINRFGAVLVSREGVAFSAIEAILQELAEYAEYHFTEEESLMVSAGLDPRHITQHRAVHQNFFSEVSQLRDALSPDNPDAARYLLQFLTHWLAYHILGSDRLMARQMAAIRDGKTAEQAYSADSLAADAATDTLLLALNSLFQQVSERNRELVQLNQTLEARVDERTLALSEANQRLEDLAMTDTLTQLPNRRFALTRFEQEWHRSVAEDAPLACLMIDADGFKVINDTYGHDAGDEVLRQLSRKLQHSVRSDDVVCRLGGDEFLVICPGTALDGAMQIAEKLRSEVAAMRVPAGSGEWRGSLSIGVAVRTDAMRAFDELMKAADSGVYVAKRNGRNLVAAAVVADAS